MNADFAEEQELLGEIKPHLRFQTGDIVFQVTDIQRKIPLLVEHRLSPSFDEDYTVSWFDTSKNIRTAFMHDVALIPDDREGQT